AHPWRARAPAQGARPGQRRNRRQAHGQGRVRDQPLAGIRLRHRQPRHHKSARAGQGDPGSRTRAAPAPDRRRRVRGGAEALGRREMRWLVTAMIAAAALTTTTPARSEPLCKVEVLGDVKELEDEVLDGDIVRPPALERCRHDPDWLSYDPSATYFSRV